MLNKFIKQLPYVRLLLSRLNELSERILVLEKLHTDADIVSAGPIRNNRIDLVKQEDLLYYIYTEDLAYQWVPETGRNYQLSQKDFKPTDQNYFSAEKLNPHTLFEMILSHYWMHNLDFTVIDVGCQYGRVALKIANFIRITGHDNHVICFEPGLAGTLLKHNISLNGLQQIATQVEYAVCNHNLPVLMYGEIGHSENNRIVNRRLEKEGYCYVVPSTTIDDYVQKNQLKGHLIIKIDTQGAEIEVLEGMVEVLENRNVTYVLEFTPWAISRLKDPSEFLTELMENTYVVDIINTVTGNSDTQYTLIQKMGIKSFINDVANNRPFGYTDILVVPKKLPGAEHLLKQIGCSKD
jgi:FkbM family methyltransferase